MKNKQKEERMVQKNMSKQLNETKVRCEICGKEFEQITNTHLKIHDMTMCEYRDQFPDALLISEGCRKKHSDSKKASWKDPEYREVHSGENNGMYGKEGWNKGETKETNDRIKKAGEKQTKTKKEFFATEKGQKWLDKHIRGENAPMYGKHQTEEAKQKQREAQLGKPSPMKGKYHTEESKQKMRDSNLHLSGEDNGMYGKGYLFIGEKNPMYGVEPWNKGETKETNETVKISGEKLSKTKKEFFQTEKGQKYIEKHFEGENNPFFGKGLFGKDNPMYGKHTPLTEEHLRKILKTVCASPNKKEQYLFWILHVIFPKEYKFVGDGSVIIGGHCPDFINVNGQKKLIEFYGDYWHKGDDEGNRIFGFKLFGFDTLVIWEHELNDDKIEMTIAKIIEFHYRK